MPYKHPPIIRTNAVWIRIGPWWTNVGDILTETQTFFFNEMLLNMPSVKLRPLCSAHICVKYVSILVEGVILSLQLGWVPPLFHQSPSISLCRHYHNRIHHAEHTTRLILNRIKSSYLMKSRICEILCLPTYLFWNWEGASRAKLYKHDIFILRISQDFTKPLGLVITLFHKAYDVALQRKKIVQNTHSSSHYHKVATMCFVSINRKLNVF